MAGGETFHIEVGDLRKLMADIRKVDKEIPRELTNGLRDGAKIIAEEAKKRASFSKRIPRTIRAAASGSKATVKAGGKRAPHAAALENNGKAGTFRHPVYGNRDVWVDQQSHPYLAPAAEAKEGEVADVVAAAVDKAIDKFLRGMF